MALDAGGNSTGASRSRLVDDLFFAPAPPRWRLAAVLFLVTLVTTTVVGARLQYNFSRGLPAYCSNNDIFPFPWAWHHPGLIAGGLPFSAALMGILLAHELGHWVACSRYGLDSTLPMFLPAPTLIGTMGAFIRIKSPFNDPREVFDVGIAGPLAGIVVTLPLLIYGLIGSHVLSPSQTQLWSGQWLEFGWPPLAAWMAAWLHPGIGVSRIALSPVARAAWFGLLVTMLNLLPAAQLDGGHILYAVSPRLHAATSWGTLVLLTGAGWLYWPGWYVFAGFVAAMRVRHPQVPFAGRLGPWRASLALLTLAIFLVTFTAAPVVAP